jgi:hypothetical protein
MFTVHPAIHFHPSTFNGSLVSTIESKPEKNIRMAPKFLFYILQKYYTHKSCKLFYNICTYYCTEYQNHKIQGCQLSAGNIVSA